MQRRLRWMLPVMAAALGAFGPRPVVAQDDPPPADTAARPGGTIVPLPALPYRAADGAIRAASDGTDGRPLLVSLWASWMLVWHVPPEQ